MRPENTVLGREAGQNRRGGVLLHPTSLPSGTLACAGEFIEWMQAAGLSVWQLLPLNPVGPGGSPYSSPASAALNTDLLDGAALVAAGWIEQKHLTEDDWRQKAARSRVDHDEVEVREFAATHPGVADHARFVVACETTGQHTWQQFPPKLRDLHAVDELSEARWLEVVAEQLLMSEQWRTVRDLATEAGIIVLGDLPLFVSAEGADAWLHRDMFCWAGQGRPSPTTGAPPDAFSDMGQSWGTPHYHWAHHDRDCFRWWRTRFLALAAQADVVRIDHFRGLCAAWAVPDHADGDARLGHWMAQPGETLMGVANEVLGGLPFVAEDLGHITPDVHALRVKLGLMGMKVLQFASPGNEHDPRHWPNDDWVVYTGTHDNNTAVGWWQELSDDHRHSLVEAGFVRDPQSPASSLIDCAWESRAWWAIAPMQDWMGLDGSARMNCPGTVEGNWAWRLDEIPWGLTDGIRQRGETAGRG